MPPGLPSVRPLSPIPRDIFLLIMVERFQRNTAQVVIHHLSGSC